MGDPAYIIRLSSNLYLDSDGVLHQGAQPPVSAYDMPGGLLTFLNGADKIAKTFNDIGDALPAKSEGAKFDKFSKKLADLGAPPILAKILGVIGTIATVIGNVFIVVGVLVSAAKLLGLFGDGPSPLEQLIDARFKALQADFRSLQRIIAQYNLDTANDYLGSARSQVQDFVSQRDSGTMTVDEIEAQLNVLVPLLTLVSAPQIKTLLNAATYVVFFDQDEHTKVWPFISTHLYTVSSDAGAQPAIFPPSNQPRVDSRLAIPLASHAAQTFLALVATLYPEYRTTGHFRSTLREFADKLSSLATSVRNETLARTIYTAADFGMAIDDFYVLDLLPGITVPQLRPDFQFVVGALDLSSHNDKFFVDAFAGGVPFPGRSRRGGLDFRWPLPAKLQLLPLPPHPGWLHTDGTPIRQYAILNPQECADAANDQAGKDYADLLVSSGYMTLVQLSAQLRHAATQPDHSETVSGDVAAIRHSQPGTQVTVHSGNLFPVGQIEAQAWREPQRVKVLVSATTQPVSRPPALIHYQIFLRTLRSRSTPLSYEPVQYASYSSDPLHPGFQRLYLHTSPALVLHEELLFEGTSQSEARRFNKTLDVMADTFDWWIPVKPLVYPHDRVFEKTRQLAMDSVSRQDPGSGMNVQRSLGMMSHERVFAGSGVSRTQSTHVDSNTLTNVSLSTVSSVANFFGIGWEEGTQTWEGQRREYDQVSVQVQVKAHWQADGFHLDLENRPEDRNYVMFLVFEETFGSIETDEIAPKVIHTAFPIQINGQLTYVPQSLFDAEKDARRKQQEFAMKYAVSAKPKPGDPVIGTIQPGEVSTDAGAARLTAALRQLKPELFEQLLSKELSK